MKRVLSLVFALVFILGFAVGCGNVSETPDSEDMSTEIASENITDTYETEQSGEAQKTSSLYPLSDELVTLTYWGMDQSSTNPALPTFGDMSAYDIWEFVEQETGVHLEFTTVSSTTENEKLNLMLASGVYCDIMMINSTLVSGGMSFLYGEDIIVDIADNVQEYMPNYYGFISADEQALKLAYDDDGHMYGTRAFAEDYVPNSGLVIRHDLVKNLGMELPTTIDDLYNLLTAFKTEYDMQSPLWMSTSGQTSTHIVGAMGSVGFASEFGSYTDHIYQSDGEISSGLLDDEYLEYLKLMNKWYSEGLFLSDFATQTDMDASDRLFLNGDTGVLSAMYGQALSLQNNLQALDSSAELYAIPTPVKNPGDENPYFNFSPLSNRAWCTISTTCYDLELTLRYMDWWFTDDGFNTANYGVEGLSFEFDENGNPYYSDAVTQNEWGIDAASAIEAFVTTNPIIGILAMDRSVYLVGEDWVTDMLDIWTQQANDSKSLPSGVTLTTQESEDINISVSDISTYATETILKFIIGDMDFSGWDSYKDELMRLGLQDIIDTYQAAYNRYVNR